MRFLRMTKTIAKNENQNTPHDWPSDLISAGAEEHTTLNYLCLVTGDRMETGGRHKNTNSNSHKNTNIETNKYYMNDHFSCLVGGGGREEGWWSDYLRSLPVSNRLQWGQQGAARGQQRGNRYQNTHLARMLKLKQYSFQGLYNSGLFCKRN